MDMEKEHHHNNISWFSLLLEGCISTIISFTSPKDASRFSILSPSFKSAADSDTVWERFLPSDYEEIIGRCVSPLTLNTSKKQLYFLLCDPPILLDNGKLSMNLVKATGEKCYMISSRGLEITWGNSPEYWNWISIPESRFAEVAELSAVCWLEIRGKIRAEMLSANTTYAAYLVFGLKQGNAGLGEACKAFVRISSNDEARIELSEVNAEARVVYLQVPSRESRTRRGVRRRMLVEPLPNGIFARERGDGWMELKLGEFLNCGEGEEDAKSIVEMMLWESELLNWKHGLVVEGIEVRPL